MNRMKVTIRLLDNPNKVIHRDVTRVSYFGESEFVPGFIIENATDLHQVYHLRKIAELEITEETEIADK